MVIRRHIELWSCLLAAPALLWSCGAGGHSDGDGWQLRIPDAESELVRDAGRDSDTGGGGDTGDGTDTVEDTRDGTDAVDGGNPHHRRTEASNFVQIDAVYNGACAVTTGGDLECWPKLEERRNPARQRKAPAADFEKVSLGRTRLCGLTDAGDILCWRDDSTEVPEPPDETYVDLAISNIHGCAITEQQRLECWGQWGAVKEAPTEGEERFREVDAQDGNTCALREDGEAVCWGLSTPELPPGRYRQISVGRKVVCGVTTDGVARCTTISDYAPSELADPPDTGFRAASADRNHGCGIRPDGTVECWSILDAYKQGPPSGLQFAQIDTAETYSCGITRDGRVVCWGIGPGWDGWL
jgi:hypothetical protein